MPIFSPKARLPLLLGIGAGVLIAFPALIGRGCPIRDQTGMLCPGCGGTRAAAHLVHGEWKAAWQDNALIFLLLAGIILQLRSFIAERRGQGRLRSPLQLNRNEAVILLGIIVVFTIVRNLPAAGFLRP